MSREEEGEERYYQPPTLGDLSRGIAHERGETFQDQARGGGPMQGRGPGQPWQIADQARPASVIETLSRDPVSKIAPALAYQVQSTYDARPVQGYDFQHSSCGGLEWGTAGVAGAGFAPVDFTFRVPENTIAVLRSFRYQATMTPINGVVEGGCWLMSDIIVNGLPVREYERMIHPVFMKQFFPTFVIADSNVDVTLRVRMATEPDGSLVEFFTDMDLNDLVSPVLGELYGNIILKTGIPKEFEIANKIY